MTEAELQAIETEIAIYNSLRARPARALAAEVHRLRAALATFVQPCWCDGRYVAVAIQAEWAAAVAAAEKALS